MEKAFSWQRQTNIGLTCRALYFKTSQTCWHVGVKKRKFYGESIQLVETNIGLTCRPLFFKISIPAVRYSCCEVFSLKGFHHLESEQIPMKMKTSRNYVGNENNNYLFKRS